jgi:hypothetical protein
MAFEDILYEVEAGVATVTLNRPDRLNAWRGVMEAELRQAMRLAADDAEVKVIVLTGAGRGFCAGADMDVLQGAVSAGGTGGGAPDAFDPASPETALSLAFTAVPDTAPASPETALSLARASASATAFRCAAAEAVAGAYCMEVTAAALPMTHPMGVIERAYLQADARTGPAAEELLSATVMHFVVA